VQRSRQLKGVSVRKKAQGRNRGINVQTGGETGGDCYRQKLVAGEGKHLLLSGDKKKRLPKQPFL
jgi:hypothetical protein